MNRMYNGKEVAVKVWNDSLQEKNKKYFIQEVMAGCMLKHPNCIQYYGYSLTPTKEDERGNPYYPKPIIVMEKGGKSLLEYMMNNTVSLEQRIDFIKQIAVGILYIHSQNLIHRDIKV